MSNDAEILAQLVAQVRRSELAKARPAQLDFFSRLVAHRDSAVDARIEALGGFGSKAMSTNVQRCKKFIRDVFSTEYPGSKWSLDIKEGKTGRIPLKDRDEQYQLQVVLNSVVSTSTERSRYARDATERFIRRFWAPHLESESGFVIYGEPYFIRRKLTSGTGEEVEEFIRDPDINSGADRKLGENEAAHWTYLRAGEVRALLEITALFAQENKRLGVTASRNGEDLDDVLQAIGGDERASLIIVGNTQSNAALSIYQKSYKFRYYSEGKFIIDREDADKIYSRSRDSGNGRGTAYVLVSRRPGEFAGTITMIASDSGRGMTRVGHLICSDEFLKELFESVSLRWPSTWPSLTFQFLLEVSIVGERGTRCKVKDAWCPQADVEESLDD